MNGEPPKACAGVKRTDDEAPFDEGVALVPDEVPGTQREEPILDVEVSSRVLEGTGMSKAFLRVLIGPRMSASPP